MDGFLVIARCPADDVPLRLFAGRKEAEDYAAGVTEDEGHAAARDVYGGDVSEVICMWVIRFRGGHIVESYNVRNMDGDPGLPPPFFQSPPV